MSKTLTPFWDRDNQKFASELSEHLVGQTVVAAELGVLSLSDGTRLVIDKENSDCCSWIELTGVNPTEGLITSVKVDNTDDYEGEYKAWISVVTEAGELNIAEADADATNGYYLHGFALDVTVYAPGEEIE